MTPLEQFLQEIQPGLTMLAALFGGLLVSLRLFWSFFNYEKELQEENINRVKELNLTFRKKHIETRLEELLSKWKLEGFNWGIDAIRDAIYPARFDPATSQKNQTLLPEGELISALINFDDVAAKAQISSEANEFKFSDAGQSFFNTLDRLYAKKLRINKEYKNCKLFCRIVSGCCLVLTVLFLAGMLLQLYKSDNLLTHFWIFGASLTFFVGLASFCLMHYYRYSLNANWENQYLYGEED